MQNMIDDRRNAEKKEDKADLFTTLLDANDEEADRKLRLTDGDLMGTFLDILLRRFYSRLWVGNVYVFLIAGHEVRYAGRVRLTNAAHVSIELRLRGIRWPSRSHCWRCIQTNKRNCISISKLYCRMAGFL